MIDRFSRMQHDNRKRGFIGTDTGIKFFQDLGIEFVPGQIWMIGGFTSVGKTATMIEMLSRIYENRNPKGIVISTEMVESAVIGRYIANKTGINARVINSGRMLPNHREIADARRDELREKDLKIVDYIKNIEQIENIVRMSEGVDFVFVDFIQNIRKQGARSKYEESSQVAIDLQNLAKDCNTCIICLSQLTLSQSEGDAISYKGAGELGEAADIGIHLKASNKDEKRLMVKIKKNRHGAKGEFILEYINNWTSLQKATE